MSTLVAIAVHPRGSPEMIARLAANPPWRSWFLTELWFLAEPPSRAADLEALLTVFLGLKDTPYPPTAAELRPLLDQLIRQDLIELSYYAWLQFLPEERLREVGHLYNGSFELEPTNLPFDWVLTPIAGADIRLARRSDLPDKRALLIEFLHTRVPFRNVRQMVMLPPGSYRLTGRYETIDLNHKRGMVWRIYCAGQEQSPIAESGGAFGTSSTWKEFTVSFEVPTTDCRAQWLRLELAARIDAEAEVSGSIWFDELQIERLKNPH